MGGGKCEFSLLIGSLMEPLNKILPLLLSSTGFLFLMVNLPNFDPEKYEFSLYTKDFYFFPWKK
jgi:hypothetical protein